MGDCCSVPSNDTEQITLHEISFFPMVLWTGKSMLTNTEIKQEAKKARVELHTSSQTKKSQPKEITEVLFYAPKFPLLIKFAKASQLTSVDFFYSTSQFFGCGIIDRTGTLQGPVKTKVLDPVPPFNQGFTKTLSQVCNDRAREIMQAAMQNNFTIKILWNGGIDSTAIVVAFMNCFDIDTLRDKVEILYCSQSLRTQDYFYYKYKKVLKFCYWSGCYEQLLGVGGDTNESSLAQIESHNILVTGEHCDQLLGNNIIKRAMYGSIIGTKKNLLHGALDKPWFTVVPKMLEQTGSIPEGSWVAWVQWILPQVVKSPIPIRTVFDFLWWFNFSMQWQDTTMRILTKCTLNPGPLTFLYSRMFHFYRSDDFQQWSYHNHSLKLPQNGSWSWQQQPLQLYIRNYTRDIEYFNYDVYEASSKPVYTIQNSYGPNLAISSNYDQIGWGDHSISVELMKLRYGPNPFEGLLVVPQEQQQKANNNSNNQKNDRSSGNDSPERVHGVNTFLSMQGLHEPDFDNFQQSYQEDNIYTREKNSDISDDVSNLLSAFGGVLVKSHQLANSGVDIISDFYKELKEGLTSTEQTNISQS